MVLKVENVLLRTLWVKRNAGLAHSLVPYKENRVIAVLFSFINEIVCFFYLAKFYLIIVDNRSERGGFVMPRTPDGVKSWWADGQ